MNPNAIISLLIQLVSGAVGGDIVGSFLEQYDLGVLRNSITGIVGGGLGGQLLVLLLGGSGAAAGSGGLDVSSILAQVAGGGVGGGIVIVIVGLIRQALSVQATGRRTKS